MRTRVRYNYQDYLSIPEDISRRHEIVDGELFVTAAPRFRHQQVVLAIAAILRELALDHGLGEVATGPVTVHLNDELVVEPDVIFVSRERLGLLDPEGGVHGPPDLVVEVLSPSNRSYDRNLKRKYYLENGVPELWLADADERTMEIWRPGPGESRTVQEVVTWNVGQETFEIGLAEVFRDTL